ncbi:MAG: flagellar hook protein FlgE [Armatimonadota bacterium]|nr:flagellar hook protein FlgE [bacterium]
MIQAMYSGISGMKAFKSSLDVIGNNIANTNTVGYKAGRATFKEMLAQTLTSGSAPSENRGGVNASQLGLGVVMGSIDTNDSQGSMTATGRNTDLAIEGNGLFALGGGDKVAYTRDGSFTLDGQYNLVSSSSGLKVLGWAADLTTGEIDTSKPVTGNSGIRIPIGSLSVARQTSQIDLAGNLDASADVGDADDVVPLKFDIYDSLGLTHEMRVEFKKVAADATWEYKVFCPDVDATNAVYTGNISFDSHGYSTLDKIDLAFNFTTDTGSVEPLVATLNTANLSQLKGTSTANLSYQDGLQLGTLESFSIDKTGEVVGTFTNGSTRTLGQIALAKFNNPAGLTKTGSNLYAESPNSGSASLGIPGESSLGQIDSGYLEASNVDLAAEFANMIVAQRGFQANSRIITTADEVLQELVSLKR